MNNLVCPQTSTNGNSGSMIQTQRDMIYRAPIFIKARNSINKSDKIKILHETEGK